MHIDRVRRLIALLLVAALIPAAIVEGATPANAYVLLGVKWASSNLTYTNMTSGLYATASNGAIGSWHGLTDVNLTSAGSSPLRVGTYYSADGFAGKTTKTSSGTTILTSVSNGNTYYMAGYSANKKRALYAHELGHALGLDHAEPNTVMANGISWFDVFGVYIPTADDINGMNSMY